jgi:hypothetical protein
MSLASAVLALVVSLSLMSAGTLFLLNETRLAENSVAEAQASGAAERAVGTALEDWEDGRDARPLGGGLFLVDVTGTATDAGPGRGGRSRLGLLVSLEPPAFPEAALVSGGSVALSPGASIEGAIDSGVSGAGLTGELDLGRVASLAGVVLPGGRYGSWSSRATGQDPPVVHIQGDAELDGGEGSGVILVDGDLRVGGAFTFSGVILVRGALVVSGSGTSKSHIYGSVVTFMGATGDSSMWITYSKTIVQNVLGMFGRPKTLSSRSWIKLF